MIKLYSNRQLTPPSSPRQSSPSRRPGVHRAHAGCRPPSSGPAYGGQSCHSRPPEVSCPASGRSSTCATRPPTKAVRRGGIPPNGPSAGSYAPASCQSRSQGRARYPSHPSRAAAAPCGQSTGRPRATGCRSEDVAACFGVFPAYAS